MDLNKLFKNLNISRFLVNFILPFVLHDVKKCRPIPIILLK